MDAGLVIAISLAVAFAVTNGVQVQASEEGETVVEDIEAQAEEVEEQLVEVEEKVDDPTKVAERGAARLTPDD